MCIRDRVNLDSFLRSIEKANGITRYSLWVQWQDPTAPLPPGTNFPETWPPSLRYHIEFISRPVAQTDVLTAVSYTHLDVYKRQRLKIAAH